MKIVKCSKCNKFIHKDNKCFHCGNTVGFDNVEMPVVHENVRSEYETVNFLIETRNLPKPLHFHTPLLNGCLILLASFGYVY